MLIYFKKSYMFILFFVLVSSSLFSQDTTFLNKDLGDGAAKVVTLESWDEVKEGAPYGWRLIGDKEIKTIGVDGVVTYDKPDYAPKLEDLKLSPEFTREVKLVDGASSSLRLKNRANTKVLGVKFNFLYPGYNNVVIEPPKIDAFKINRRAHILDQSQAKHDSIHGIEIPGLARKISVWVLGRGFNYDLEGIIEDYKGGAHTLKFGTINFIGWRNLIVDIPIFVEQSAETFPSNQNLVFKKFVIRSKPQSKTGPIIVFLDELKALVVPHESYFDGSDIHFDRTDCEDKNRNNEFKGTCEALGGANNQPAAQGAAAPAAAPAAQEAAAPAAAPAQ